MIIVRPMSEYVFLFMSMFKSLAINLKSSNECYMLTLNSVQLTHKLKCWYSFIVIIYCIKIGFRQ